MNKQAFRELTGHPPFPWQEELYRRFVAGGEYNIPSSASLPTGTGKTSVIGIWLLALLNHPDAMPRRLVYVVNRRTVIDQTTAEVERYRQRVDRLEHDSPLKALVKKLGVSTLRGQLADNREWSEDPSRPAVICGTVDMIGSRLLFGGYRIGFKSRPLHAGLLGQDALLVHDEAHLEPAFQKLVESIEKEQSERERTVDVSWPKLRVMALSATVRSHDDHHKASEQRDPFELTDQEKQPPEHVPDPPTEPIHHIWRRLKASKTLHLDPCEDERKQLADQIMKRAHDLSHEKPGDSVLIFATKVEDVYGIVKALKDKKKGNVPADHVETLTGTMRGYERDKLVRANPVFARFLPESDRAPGVAPAEGTVYLVCTSAGEVGVNLSADHMVCDLSTFDSMAQRLGRVNRFGDRDDTRVDVVHPTAFGGKQTNAEVESRREKTLALLQQLNGDASPKALSELPADQRPAAFAPEPTILPATDILFDAWAMTTIRDRMPGRPPVAPYLHGVAEWEPPRTSVAWREEVQFITDQQIERERDDFPQDLLADYPLKPHELLSDTSERILTGLQELAKNHPEAPVWLVDPRGRIDISRLSRIADPAATKKPDRERLKQGIAESTVLLPPSVGGLTAQGTLDGAAGPEAGPSGGYDVADQWVDEENKPRRRRVRTDDPQPPDRPDGLGGMALVRTVDLDSLAEEFAPAEAETEAEDEDEGEPEPEAGGASARGRFWHWYVRPRDAEDATAASIRPITWKHHTDEVVRRTKDILGALNLPRELKEAVLLAAELHDLGKKREIWQRSIGNPDPADWHAKSGKPTDGPRWRPRRLSGYRHELGSLLDVLDLAPEHAEKLAKLSEEMRDVVLHLIGAHHGYARPHFPPGAYDHERHNTEENHEAAHEVMRRYARLQRRYGRWGLAYLESLLRAADRAASADPDPGDTPDNSGGHL